MKSTMKNDVINKAHRRYVFLPACFTSLIFILCITLTAASRISSANDDFRINPYLQNPAPEAITILWFSEMSNPGSLLYGENSEPENTLTSSPVLAGSLAYPAWENETFFDGKAPAPYTAYGTETEYNVFVHSRTGQYPLQQLF